MYSEEDFEHFGDDRDAYRSRKSDYENEIGSKTNDEDNFLRPHTPS